MARCWGRAYAPAGAYAIAARVAAAVAVVGAVLPATATPGGAHARVTGSLPTDGDVVATPPAEVSLFLDAKPATAEGDPLQVFAPDGRRVDTGQARVSPDGRTLTVAVDRDRTRPAGRYQLVYRVVSADTHVISGRITYSARQPAAAGGRARDGRPAGSGRLGWAWAPGGGWPSPGPADPTAPRLAPGGPDGLRLRVAAGAAAVVALLTLAVRILRPGRPGRPTAVRPARPGGRRRRDRTTRSGRDQGGPGYPPARRPPASARTGRNRGLRIPDAARSSAPTSRRRPHRRAAGVRPGRRPAR
jgi:methionine-rich copper-binding protein CopC